MRPRIQRPAIRGLGTPSASHRRLSLEMPDGRSIALDSEAFRSELNGLRVLTVDYHLGSFLLIAERRKRGDRYWVARAYHQGRRASVYLGKNFRDEDVRRAAGDLTTKLADDRIPVLPTDAATVEAVMRDLIERERDPARRAAAEAIAALIRRDQTAHRA